MMICIKLRFIVGRYHSTPWGRNVNEGVAEWPPSPYRLIRALIDCWKRKAPDIPQSDIERILGSISGKPEIFVPQAVAGHVRSYMPENKEAKKQEIFDPFISIDRMAEVGFLWPGAVLAREDMNKLENLVSMLSYFGRSESWCEASLGEKMQSNCLPCIDRSPSENQVRTRVVVARKKADYDVSPYVENGRPIGWLEAMTFSTQDMLDRKMDRPPGLEFADYSIPASMLGVRPRNMAAKTITKANCFVYQMVAKPLPSIKDALYIAERGRAIAMGIHKNIMGDPALVSPRFSGKGPDGAPLSGHTHSYFVPLDIDRDGRLDHLVVHCGQEYSEEEMLTLMRLQRIWQRGGRDDISLVMVESGFWGEMKLAPKATSFESVTPYVCTRHHRKGRGDFVAWLKKQLLEDIAEAGLPEPSQIELMPFLKNESGQIFWSDFARSRRGDAPMPAYGFTIEFDQPIPGPISVGYGAHFGLGTFIPIN
jgi:CRISPR-associated protein Csb2